MSSHDAARRARSICIGLMGAEAVTLGATVLAVLAESFSLARVLASGLFYVTALSALVGAVVVIYGVVRRVPAMWKWGAAVVVVNALPWVVILLLAPFTNMW